MNSHYYAPFAAEIDRALNEVDFYDASRRAERYEELKGALKIIIPVDFDIVWRAVADVRKARRQDRRLPYSAALRAVEGAKTLRDGRYHHEFDGEFQFHSGSQSRAAAYRERLAVLRT